ncbi:MAG TPA: S53 family peptidase [Bryobacteraceae bacterium]|nr:S53 family peptidase [Bryobacteraceae bacterium]
MHRRSSLLVCSSLLLCAGAAYPQVSRHAPALVTRSASESDRITLYGNVHPAVRQARDLGPVSDSLPLQHIYLQLKRPAAAQAALDQYLEDLHNPSSPSFHKWGTAAEFSERFGMAQSDIAAVREWLESKGFTVHGVSANLVIDFSGTAAQVRDAFHTTIHKLDVNGTPHIANLTDPQIPAAFADAVVGPVALHNFKPKPQHRLRSQYTAPNGYLPVVPYDLHTIYNLNPLFQAGVTGRGQTIVLLEDTDLYSDGDWYAFRKTFGLARRFPYGTFATVHPNGGNGGACADPGFNGNDDEAALDVEWASAAAPNAAIVLASCADTDANFGVYIALQNLLTASTQPPAIISISYGAPESELGSDGNAYVNALYQLGVFEGVSIFVSSGDEGAAGSDADQAIATHGINVNGLGSTPNNVSVGGTDFADSYFGDNAQYWSATNGPAYNSAKSYVPEIPWNDSCASTLIANIEGYPQSYGANGFCNSTLGEEYFLTTGAGSGGPSACATGAPNIFGVVGGTCKGWAKPAWQRSLFGNPNDGVRDLPDVSLMAANGVWGHYYLFCFSDPTNGGTPCNLPPVNWSGGGGTSFAAPIVAGIQSLANEAAGARQGNPNYVYYSLAHSEFGTTGKASCNASLGSAIDPSCIFHDVTLGDMDVNCQPLTTSTGAVVGRFSCFYPSTNPGTNGVLSVSDTSYEPAYPAKSGWDFATGIGTVNAYNLVANWPSAASSAKQK